jgi:hypothetical protein
MKMGNLCRIIKYLSNEFYFDGFELKRVQRFKAIFEFGLDKGLPSRLCLLIHMGSVAFHPMEKNI